MSLFWYIAHFFAKCRNEDVITYESAWNKDYPDYITPKHKCCKCGREWIRGTVYPSRPWPNPLPRMKPQRPEIVGVNE